MAEEKPIERAEDQAFGAAGCGRDDTDVLGLQAVLFKMAPSPRAGIEAERWHKAAILAQPGALTPYEASVVSDWREIDGMRSATTVSGSMPSASPTGSG